MNVLIIDSNQKYASHTANIFLMLGHNPKWTNNPMDGILASFSWQPQIITCADHFEECEGWQFVHAILAGMHKRPLLVALSESPNKRNKALSQEFGFDVYSKSPVEFRVVNELIQKMEQNHA
jgi:DNA-binding response OmpR family regulator